MGACGVSCAKYLVFLFNLLFALTGLAILTIGGYIQSSYYHYSNFVAIQCYIYAGKFYILLGVCFVQCTSFWSAPILMIIVGAIVFVIAFLGCCGAVKESSCMVLSFCIFLLIILLCELGIGIAGYIKHGQLEDVLKSGFNKTMTAYSENEHAWKLIQSEVH